MLGGPIVTAGLVFVAGAAANLLHAFDVEAGQELWQGELPGRSKATPITHVLDGEQSILIAAGSGALAMSARRSWLLLSLNHNASGDPMKNAVRWAWPALWGAVGWAVVGSLVLWHVIFTLDGTWVSGFAVVIFARATAPIAAPLGMLHGAWRAPNGGLTGSALAVLMVLPIWSMNLATIEYPIDHRREFMISIVAALLAGFCAGAVTARLTRVWSSLLPWTRSRALGLLTLWATLALFELIFLAPPVFRLLNSKQHGPY